MSNVITLFGDEKDLQHCTYYVDQNDEIALSMRDKSLLINRLGLSIFQLTLYNESRLYNREQLAEFIHVASALIDSEERWRPNEELVGVNYAL